MSAESMVALKRSQRTARPQRPEQAETVRVLLPVNLARRAKAYGAMQGERGPRLAIERALEEFFKKAANVQTPL